MKKIIYILIALSVFSLAKTYKGAEYRTLESFLYGKFEVRMKSAEAVGMLSSFFTYHDRTTQVSENWNEIDLEILGRYNDRVQFNTITPGVVNHEFFVETKFNPNNSFHVYAIEWTPDYVSWSIDGYEVARQTGDHIKTLTRAQKLMMNIWPPNYPDWTGILDAADLPLYAYYDWVKVYDYTPAGESKFTLKWEDNFDYPDPFKWESATHTWDGNNSDFVKANVVFKDGYMILCLTKDNALGYNGDDIIDEDIDAPYICEAWSGNNNILIKFSEEINLTSAVNLSNYITPGLTVSSIKLLDDKRTVSLSIDGKQPNTNYNLLVKDIEDYAGNKMELSSRVMKNIIPDPIKINAGGENVSDFFKDQIWDFNKEYGYDGGTLKTVSSGLDGIYKSYIEGITYYTIRVEPGNYSLNLFFAEVEKNATGERIFDIVINGEIKTTDLDIFKEVGKNSEVIKSYTNVNSIDGFITIGFNQKISSSILSGVEVTKNLTAINEINVDNEKSFINSYPNPFNNSAKILFNSASDTEGIIVLYNVLGEKILSRKEIINRGENIFNLNFSSYPSGIYFIKVITQEDSYSRKLVLQK